MRHVTSRHLGRLMLIGTIQACLLAAVTLPAVPAAACTIQGCKGGGGTGGGGTGGGGTGGGGQSGPGPLGFSSDCAEADTGGTVLPGQRDACDTTVDFGKLTSNATVTFAVSVATTGSGTSASPMSCTGTGVDAVVATGANSCTYAFPDGAGGGAIVGQITFRAPFDSAINGGVHLSAEVQELNQAFSAPVSISGLGSFISRDPAPIISMDTLAMTEGQAFNGELATFTDPEWSMTSADGETATCAGTCPSPTNQEYFATIDWGDGTANASPGTVTGTSITGSHTYAEEGTYTLTVTLHDSDTPYNYVSAAGMATVVDAPLVASGRTVNSTNPLNGVVASFIDADPNGTVADYTASIDWGDGTSSPGSVTQGAGEFDVNGSHTYANLGPYQVTVNVCDVGGSCAQAVSQVLIYAYSNRGNFVIGDGSGSAGSTATFWGSAWSAANSTSGGTPPADFKGFSDQPNQAPSCGTSWSTTPGNSAHPPATVPSYMAAIVTSGVARNGAQLAGDTADVVVIKTDAGYLPDPGQVGTGTVVAVLCST